VLISVFLILFILAGSGICGTIYYYRRYTDTKASLSVYIELYRSINNGFDEAKQLIQQLGERNKTIADAARKGLQLIEGKLKTTNEK